MWSIVTFVSTTFYSIALIAVYFSAQCAQHVCCIAVHFSVRAVL